MKFFSDSAKRPAEEKSEAIRALIVRAREGDNEAFDEIAKLFEKKVFWVAYAVTGNMHDAEDVTQEVLFKVFRNLGKLKNEEKFRTWLYRITIHASWDYLKEFRAPQAAGGVEAFHESVQQSAADVFERKEVLENILRFLKSLARNEKTVFVLRDIEGREVKKIAKIMNISRITVRRHLSNARRKMRGKLSAVYPEFKVKKNGS